MSRSCDICVHKKLCPTWNKIKHELLEFISSPFFEGDVDRFVGYIECYVPEFCNQYMERC